MPGWEPEKLDQISELFEAYKDIDEEKLWENFAYFINAIIPTAERCGIKMAIHPDDPPYSIFNLPRIITGADSYERECLRSIIVQIMRLRYVRALWVLLKIMIWQKLL